MAETNELNDVNNNGGARLLPVEEGWGIAEPGDGKRAETKELNGASKTAEVGTLLARGIWGTTEPGDGKTLESKELNGASKNGEVEALLAWGIWKLETRDRAGPVVPWRLVPKGGPRALVRTGRIAEVGQKQPCLQSAQAQPIPHGQAAAGVRAGGQNQPPVQSRHSKPLPGQGLPLAEIVACEGTTAVDSAVKLPNQCTVVELRNSVKFAVSGGQNHPLGQPAHRKPIPQPYGFGGSNSGGGGQNHPLGHSEHGHPAPNGQGLRPVGAIAPEVAFAKT
ncbi:MAG: hypothetical protein M1839_006996 [Geoglossum umbratile]|nr:MAG: hypothetical protein M1839_006996 [Geoglossum umbratile]